MDSPHSPSFCDNCDICFYYNTFEIRDLPLSNPWSREDQRRSSTSSHVDYRLEAGSFSLPGVSSGEYEDFQTAINNVAQRYDQVATANQWNSFAFYDTIRRGGPGRQVVKRKPVPPPRDEQAFNARSVSSPMQMQHPAYYYPGDYSGPAELDSPNIGSFSVSHSDSPGSVSDEEAYHFQSRQRKHTPSFSGQSGDSFPEAVMNSPKLQRTFGVAGNRNSIAAPTIRAVPAVADVPTETSASMADKYKAKRLQKKWRYSMSG